MKQWKLAALAVALLAFGAMTVTGSVVHAEAAPKDGKTVTAKKSDTKAASKAVSKKDNTKKKSSAAATDSKKNKASTAPKTKGSAGKTGSSKAEKAKGAKGTKVAQASKADKSKTKGKKGKKGKTQATSERDVWMQRAQNSSDLLGKASWYGADFHGGTTASGVEYDMNSYTAAHRTLPLGTVVEVTEENSGRSVLVCINNRGPFKAGRVIDLSQAAASDLGIKQRGIAPVNLKVITDAEGQTLNSDEAFFVKVVRKQNAEEERVGPFNQYADASVMQEVLRNQYPEAAIVLGPVASK